MRSDYWQFFTLLLVSLIAGGVLFAELIEPLLGTTLPTSVKVIIGSLSGGLMACIVYVSWHLRQLYSLRAWLENKRHDGVNDLGGTLLEMHSLLSRRKKRDRTRKQNQKALLKQVRNALAALPDALVFVDENAKIEFASPNASTMLGVRWPNDKGVYLTDLIRGPELAVLLATTHPEKVARDGVEIRFGQRKVTTLNLKAIPYTQGLTMVVARDVSRLVNINQMQTDFVANVSHELKTPLTVLKGYIEIVQGKIAQDNSSEESIQYLAPALKHMEVQSERMEAIVQDLLLLSALEDNSTLTPHREIDMTALIQSAKNGLDQKLEDKNQSLELQISPDLALMGNEKELHSAITNLLINAISYTPKGGKLAINWFEHDGHKTLSVSDNGPGIEASHLPRLTERFYRINDDRSRESGGTGLGLAIVKHILQRHNARLKIISEIDKGSEFLCVFSNK